MLSRLFTSAVLGCLSLILVAGPAFAADTLAKIKERGHIVIGVKADYKPWGFLDPQGKHIGMEIDMADDIAKRLKTKVEFVTLQSGNRNEFLIQGKIDLILATMSDSPQRREALGIVEPAYYAGGTNIMAKKSLGFKKWEDVRGKKVCGIQGAYYNRRVGELYGAEIVSFPGIAEALTDLRAGNCVAFLQDSTLIESMLSEGDKWGDYEMPLPTEDEKVWVMAVPKDEQNGPYGKFISATITEWHKTGYLVELEKKWNLKASPFLKQMHDKYK